MAAVVVQGGLDAVLALFTAGASQQFVTLHLFSSNTTPSVTDTVGMYTECSFSGYGTIGINPGDWTSPSGGSQPRTVVSDTYSFVFGGGVTPDVVYGYYITAAGVLVCAERGTGVPYTMAVDGDQVDVTITIDSENA